MGGIQTSRADIGDGKSDVQAMILNHKTRKESTDSENDIDESCIFCLIANDHDEYAEIMQKNDELVCFRDICPAAPHHYLVIPRKHMLSCFSLYKEHVGLVKRMADMGKAVLRSQGVADLDDIRMGFHIPPYTSVDHIHLHVLAPASQITDDMEYKFLPGKLRFITEDCLRMHLCDDTPELQSSEVQICRLFSTCKSQSGLLDSPGAPNMSEESLNQNEANGLYTDCTEKTT